MKTLMKLTMIVFLFVNLLLTGCTNKKLKQSFLDYRLEQSMGIKMDHQILDFEVLNTVTNKESVTDDWQLINDFIKKIKFDNNYLDKFLNQENKFRSNSKNLDYYKFAQENKGLSQWIDDYLEIMQVGLNVKQKGIENATVSEKMQIIIWYEKRQESYYSRHPEIFPLSIDEIKNIESIMNGEEQDEYFRVRIKYIFKNPILNNAEVQLEEIYHYDMNGKCISVEEK